MANKMLIDASHPEETRVVVVRGQRVEEFDFEAASRRPLRGNIYLAKVTRVEPSLQAAFIEYGGNRHGFLAFSEIHPDYYQIPVADRQALIEEELRAEEDAERESERRERGGRNRNRRRRGGQPKAAAHSDAVSAEAGEAAAGGAEGEAEDAAIVAPGAEEEASTVEAAADETPEQAEEQAVENGHGEEPGGAEAKSDDDGARDHGDDRGDDNGGDENGEENGEEAAAPEQIGAGDALDDIPERPRLPRRQYKIQEVIKRRQILLVQVVKEERGNKGAALTTYLSLAGRYSVLMPNTGRGGGISRKITNSEDRKRLKEIAGELEVPDGMGIILRTAGASRTKPEIKRDYEYLMRLWESVRELTLASSAPALVYEEGSLIKRAIRDLYNKDIDDILVAGEAGYREAKDFMKMLMPSHAKVIQPYREAQPLFARYGVESQLDAMFANQVTLKSGGYIVINQTEALVAIDVNSGRSTREHNIEDTALKTNLEAAEEVARQLRLRDLAGLIVIDFIDMEEKRNNRTVEKKLKDCLKNDRARIQVGHISAFGLMEMSRQRIRTGVLESSTVRCAACDGAGFVRSTPSVALYILRALEEALIKSAQFNLTVKTRTEVALYILNQKRPHLNDLESRFGVTITLATDDHLTGTTYFNLERGEAADPSQRRAVTGVQAEAIVDEPDEDVADAAEDESEAVEAAAETRAPGSHDPAGEDAEGVRRRRRRRRRRGRGSDRDGAPRDEGRELDADGEDVDGTDEAEDAEVEAEAGVVADEVGVPAIDAVLEAEPSVEAEPEAAPRRRRRTSRKAEAETAEAEAPVAAAEPAAEPTVAEPEAAAEKPKRGRGRGKATKAEAEPAVEAPVEVLAGPTPEEPAEPAPAEPELELVTAEAQLAAAEEPVAVVLTPPDPDRPKRGGWWAKR